MCLAEGGDGEGIFLNAEGAKVTQRTQKGDTERIPKGEKEEKFIKFKIQKIHSKLQILFLNSLVLFLYFLFLRPLRNLRALCVQKIPAPSPVPSL
jgi:hypothetical protein